MITEKDIELIDQYLANKLTGQEKSLFEERLKNEQDLSGEFRMQQDIVHAIQKARIAELKAMLNKVPVSATTSSTTSSSLIKLTVGLTAVVIIASVTYFTVTIPKQTKQVNQENIQPQNPTEVDKLSNIDKNELAQENTGKKEVEENNHSIENQTNKKATRQPKAENQINEIKEGKAVEPKIEVFDPNSEEIQDEEKPVINDKPEEDVFTKSNTLNTEVVYKERKHNFHYQLIGDKLTLIGPFKKELYEVLEFFANDKRTAFLYFNKTYYSLTATESEKELKPVMDPKLIEKLEQYRKQN
jgi:hypothetical protein